MTKVLVSGASGFVALHIVGELLSEGFEVVGTVRSQAQADKLLARFKAKYPHGSLTYSIVPDISKDCAFDKVFETVDDIDYVLHTASPFSFGLEGTLEDIYLIPAVNGTLNMLKSVHKLAPQVSKVVVTSSMASIQNFDKVGDASFIHTESTWNPIQWDEVTDENMAYVASKKLAEKAAWDFVKDNDVKFKLNTVTPPYIFGPQYFEEDASLDKINTSSGLIAALLKSDPKDTHLFSEPSLCAVDVRDVAKAHCFALRPEISNERLFVASERFTLQGILDIINKDFPELDGKIAKGQPEGEKSIPTSYFDNSKTKEIMGGYEFVPLETSVFDTVKQLLEQGNLKSTL